jgi:hypothetical protein
MSQVPPATSRSRRGPWFAVMLGAILLGGAITLTAVLNAQPPLQPVTVSSATP